MENFWKRVIRNMVYEARFQCTNCDKTYKKSVMKYTTKVEYAKTKLCSNCGTTNLIPI